MDGKFHTFPSSWEGVRKEGAWLSAELPTGRQKSLQLEMRREVLAFYI